MKAIAEMSLAELAARDGVTARVRATARVAPTISRAPTLGRIIGDFKSRYVRDNPANWPEDPERIDG